MLKQINFKMMAVSESTTTVEKGHIFKEQSLQIDLAIKLNTVQRLESSTTENKLLKRARDFVSLVCIWASMES